MTISNSWRISAFSIALLVTTVGCEARKSEPAAPAQPTAPPPGNARPTSNQAPTPGQPQGDAVTWVMPPAWQEQPARAMRKATYRAQGPAGPAEVAVFYFGVGQGGDVEANISRWIGQFKDLPEGAVQRDQLEVEGFHVSTVRVAKGTFASGMPGGPSEAQSDWGMNAAVVETPAGPYFFKMTGPAATVDAEEARFLELLKSVRRAR